MKADADSSALLASRPMVQAKRREIASIGSIKEIAQEAKIAALFMHRPKRAKASRKVKIVLPVAAALRSAKAKAAKEKEKAPAVQPLQGKGKAEPKLDEAQLAELRAQQQIHARAELARRMEEEANISKVTKNPLHSARFEF